MVKGKVHICEKEKRLIDNRNSVILCNVRFIRRERERERARENSRFRGGDEAGAFLPRIYVFIYTYTYIHDLYVCVCTHIFFVAWSRRAKRGRIIIVKKNRKLIHSQKQKRIKEKKSVVLTTIDVHHHITGRNGRETTVV